MLDLSQDYFQLFDLPRSYTVDEEQLGEHYRQLQRTLHPDRFAHATDQERRLSMQGSTLVNEAFATLKEPLKRAIYLLGLYGESLDDGSDDVLTPAFLMEQMELREELEAVRDAADPFAALDVLNRDIRQRMQAHQAVITEHFAVADNATLKPIRILVRELQFLTKLRHQAVEMEERLDDY